MSDQIDSTSTFDLRPSDVQSVKQYDHHNLHKEDESHSNGTIDFSDTKMNTETVINNLDQLLHDQYDSTIEVSNEKLRNDFLNKKLSSARFLSRQKSIETYKSKNAFTSGVMTLGETSMLPNLLDQMGFKYEMVDVVDKNLKDESLSYQKPKLIDPKQRQEWSAFWTKVYTDTAKEIDKKGLRINQVNVHLDEAGMPHAHILMVNGGKTAKGKASTTMNSALKMYLGDKASNDSRENMRRYRALTDKTLVDTFNSTAKKMGYDVNLKMIRTHDVGGKDMPEYKKMKQAQDALNLRSELTNAVAMQSSKVYDELQGLLETVSTRNAKLDLKESDLNQKNDDLNERDSNLQDSENAFKQRLLKLQQRERLLQEREDEFNLREIENKKREKKLNEKLKEIGGVVGFYSKSDDSIELLDKFMNFIRNIKNKFLKSIRHVNHRDLNHSAFDPRIASKSDLIKNKKTHTKQSEKDRSNDDLQF